MNFYFFREFQPPVTGDTEEMAKFKEALAGVKAGRYFSYGQGKRPPLTDLASLELGRKCIATFKGDDYYLSVSRSSEKHFRTAEEVTASNGANNPAPWLELARIHFLHSRFAESASLARKATELTAGPERPHLLEILANYRGEDEGSIPDGKARALELYRKLDKDALSPKNRYELQHLTWLLEIEE